MENLNHCQEHDCFFKADVCPACKVASVLRSDVSMAVEPPALEGKFENHGLIPGTVRMSLGGGAVNIVDDGTCWLVTEDRGERVGRVDYEDGDFILNSNIAVLEASYQFKRDVEEAEDDQGTDHQ